jgi:hypothetical protein
MALSTKLYLTSKFRKKLPKACKSTPNRHTLTGMVSFKEFKYRNAPLLAHDIALVVRRMPQKLQAARPDTVKRYMCPSVARRSIYRSIKNPDIHSGAVMVDRVVEGLGSITLGQTFEHDEVGEITGSQVDYWGLDMSSSDHEQFGSQMIEKARKKGGWVIGALLEDEKEYALGISTLLVPIGQPGEFSMPYGDSFGVLSSSKPVQLYAQRWNNGLPELT